MYVSDKDVETILELENIVKSIANLKKDDETNVLLKNTTRLKENILKQQIRRDNKIKRQKIKRQKKS